MASQSKTTKTTVDAELTLKVAELARLRITSEEAKQFSQQINDILNYMELLKQVDVSKVEPLTYPLDVETPMREDRVCSDNEDESMLLGTASGEADLEVQLPKILQAAPAVSEGGFRVPKVL